MTTTATTTNTNVVRELKLHSPAGVEPAIFTWPNVEQQKTKNDAVFIGGDEIVKTIRLVFEDYPELYTQNLGLSTCDIQSYSQMKELCDKFNKIIDTHIKLNRGTEAFSARLEKRATSKLFRHILAQVYSRAVTDPDKLRNYEPFSPSVYGETSPDLIDSILKMINLTEDQTFIDLGSGVGNVVLHVAALANCKHVYGIEYEDIPAKYAQSMAEEFRSWMRWYGKQYTEFQLERGDFLTHSTVDEKIKDADVIFVNNYVFGSRVNHELKIKFMNMKDGAKIVSSREFCSETFRLNDRTKNDLGAIMHVTKPEEILGKVSWSDKSVQYYLHIIDHSKLAHYYEKAHQLHTKGPRSIPSKSNDDESSFSQSSTSSSLNDKTTRRIKVTSTRTCIKVSENELSRNNLKRKRKIKAKGNLHPTKVHIKVLPEKNHEYESDLSNNQRKVRKNYHSTLEQFHSSNLNENQRFNYQDLTKLQNDNLDLRHFRDCLVEQEDEQFFHSINSYLDRFRLRIFNYFTYMKSDVYREHLKKQLDNEVEINKTLKTKVTCLENNIKILLDDTIKLLKQRTNELGIEELERPEQLITYANDISNKHKQLRSKIVNLEKEITDYNDENEKLNFILQSIQTNGHNPSMLINSINDNAYSTLLANMSRQTQQQENTKQTYSTNRSRSSSNDLPANINKIHVPSLGTSKPESKSGFTIPKKLKKSSTNSTADDTNISPSRIVKTIDKNNLPKDTSTNNPANINHHNLLMSKQLEPVQVHSVVKTVAQQIKTSPTQPQPVIQAVSVKTLLNTSSSPSNSKSSKFANEINRTMIMQSPRKKRDFYGKSTSSSTTTISPSSSTSSLNTKSHRHSTTTNSVSPNNNRPSSTPACTTTNPGLPLPDRPISIPPLKSSS